MPTSMLSPRPKARPAANFHPRQTTTSSPFANVYESKTSPSSPASNFYGNGNKASTGSSVPAGSFYGPTQPRRQHHQQQHGSRYGDGSCGRLRLGGSPPNRTADVSTGPTQNNAIVLSPELTPASMPQAARHARSASSMACVLEDGVDRSRGGRIDALAREASDSPDLPTAQELIAAHLAGSSQSRNLQRPRGCDEDGANGSGGAQPHALHQSARDQREEAPRRSADKESSAYSSPNFTADHAVSRGESAEGQGRDGNGRDVSVAAAPSSKRSTRTPWSQTDERLLESILPRFRRGGRIHWNQLSKAFNGVSNIERTPHALRSRWFFLNPDCGVTGIDVASAGMPLESSRKRKRPPTEPRPRAPCRTQEDDQREASSKGENHTDGYAEPTYEREDDGNVDEGLLDMHSWPVSHGRDMRVRGGKHDARTQAPALESAQSDAAGTSDLHHGQDGSSKAAAAASQVHAQAPADQPAAATAPSASAAVAPGSGASAPLLLFEPNGVRVKGCVPGLEVWLFSLGCAFISTPNPITGARPAVPPFTAAPAFHLKVLDHARVMMMRDPHGTATSTATREEEGPVTAERIVEWRFVGPEELTVVLEC